MKKHTFTLKLLSGDFAVCKVADSAKINFNATYTFWAKTDKENSLVCLNENIPENVVTAEKGWRALCIEGQLDFSLLGILAGIADVLARNEISIFVVSTFDTDYIFVKTQKIDKTIQVLRQDGYTVKA